MRGNHTWHVGRGQYLLRCLAEALELNDDPVAATKKVAQKTALLRKFQESGRFLTEAARCPVNHIRSRAVRDNIIRSCSTKFCYNMIDQLIRNTGLRKIVVIKHNVYNIIKDGAMHMFPDLFVHSKIPFPCCGVQQIAESVVKKKE